MNISVKVIKTGKVISLPESVALKSKGIVQILEQPQKKVQAPKEYQEKQEKKNDPVKETDIIE